MPHRKPAIFAQAYTNIRSRPHLIDNTFHKKREEFESRRGKTNFSAQGMYRFFRLTPTQALTFEAWRLKQRYPGKTLANCLDQAYENLREWRIIQW